MKLSKPEREQRKTEINSLKGFFVPGSPVTLRYDYYGGNNDAGTKGIVLRTRKDATCQTGLRVFVALPGGKSTDLDAGWFDECPRAFKPHVLGFETSPAALLSLIRGDPLRDALVVAYNRFTSAFGQAPNCILIHPITMATIELSECFPAAYAMFKGTTWIVTRSVGTFKMALSET